MPPIMPIITPLTPNPNQIPTPSRHNPTARLITLRLFIAYSSHLINSVGTLMCSAFRSSPITHL